MVRLQLVRRRAPSRSTSTPTFRPRRRPRPHHRARDLPRPPPRARLEGSRSRRARPHRVQPRPDQHARMPHQRGPRRSRVDFASPRARRVDCSRSCSSWRPSRWPPIRSDGASVPRAAELMDRARRCASGVNAALMLHATVPHARTPSTTSSGWAASRPIAEKRLEFLEHPLWRTYVFVYSEGEALLRRWVDAVPEAGSPRALRPSPPRAAHARGDPRGPSLLGGHGPARRGLAIAASPSSATGSRRCRATPSRSPSARRAPPVSPRRARGSRWVSRPLRSMPARRVPGSACEPRPAGWWPAPRAHRGRVRADRSSGAAPNARSAAAVVATAGADPSASSTVPVTGCVSTASCRSWTP